MIPLRPEFGPTLPQLARPRVARLPRALRIALLAGALVLVALVVVASGHGGERRTTVVVRGPLAFNLLYQTDRMREGSLGRGEELRLLTIASASSGASVTVRALRIPAYHGDPSGALAVFASRLIAQMRGADPRFILRGEGRARVNSQPGYQIKFQTALAGTTIYGRRALLFADEPGIRDGADITMLAARSPAIPNVDAVGSNGPTKLAYRSFRLGTERP